MRTLLIAAAVATLTACGSSVPAELADQSGDPDPIGEPVTILPLDRTETGTESLDEPTPGPQPTAPAPTPATAPPTEPAPGAPAQPPPAEPAEPAPSPPPFRVVGEVSDPVGDAGLEAPPYADLVQVTIEDDGQVARLTVRVAGDLPGRPADGEVMGIGVDIYAEPGGESDYQVFASGNADGWSAYLQTATGLFSLPGSATLSADRLVFELDWSYLGQFPQGAFRAFVDWSRQRPVINAASSDRAPDREAAPFRR